MAYISPSAFIGVGSVIEPLASIGVSGIVDEGCFISANAVVDHDCHIGAFCHIDAGAVVCSRTVVPALETITNRNLFSADNTNILKQL